MRLGQHKMDREGIKEIIKMRRKGYSYSSIGRYFGRDHSTVMYHCKKARLSKLKGVGKKMKKPTEKPVIKKLIIQDDEIINYGKSYKDYLVEEKKRDWKKRNDVAPLTVDYPQFLVDKLKKDYTEDNE